MKKPRRSESKESRIKRTGLARMRAEFDRLFDELAWQSTWNGDPQAVELAVNIASQLCELIDHIEHYTDSVRPELEDMARERIRWPMLYTWDREQLKEDLLRMEKLPLGENTLRKKANPRRPYSLKTMANSTVAETVDSILAQRIEHGRNSLQYVSFEEVWRWITRLFKHVPPGGVSFERSNLRELGISFAESKRDTSPRGSRSYESNIRAGIKQRLRVAHRTLIVSRNPKE
jgi:hypothetical protein